MPLSCRGILRTALLAATLLALVCQRADATGVPIDGFLPMVSITLTDEFVDDIEFSPFPSTAIAGSPISPTPSRVYDLALLDTGAAISLITTATDAAFDLNGPYPSEPDGYAGTEFIPIGGATGVLNAKVSDPLGVYAAGLQTRTSVSGAPLAMNQSALLGQTNTSIATLPTESDLPNVLGLSFASQYATRIRNSVPQVFELGGKTVRSPAIDFLELGSGNTHGITRKAPMSLLGSSPSTPIYQLNFEGVLNGDDPWENPSVPTVVQGGHFLNINASNEGSSLNGQQFFFDTGASVTVLSELTALQLGIDVQLQEPDFTIEIIGSGGGSGAVPGYFIDSFTVLATGGNVTATNVPVLVLDVTNPANPGNIVPGIVGTNVFAGRDIIIDPNPSLGGGGESAGVYISDPVTRLTNWISSDASASWFGAGRWSAPSSVGQLDIANLRHVAGGDQTVILNDNDSIWELNVSGAGPTQGMTLRVLSTGPLTTFTGINIEAFGAIQLECGKLDAQYVEILGGTLRGAGTIKTGSGPIAGQVENRGGLVAPGSAASGIGTGILNIAGRFANSSTGVIEVELNGSVAGAGYDRIAIDGSAALDGTLRVLGPTFGPGIDYVVLTATEGVGGRFDVVELPAYSHPEYIWLVDYDETSVSVKITLPGDFDGDFHVDGDDLTLWTEGYGTFYTGADFLTWQRNLGRHVMIAAPIPEPATLALLPPALAALGAARLRRSSGWHAQVFAGRG
jgi:hypothetical protein